MRTRHTLAIGALAAAGVALAVTPEPVRASLNDVVTVEVQASAWTPAAAVAPTPGSTPAAATTIDDPFAPLATPAPADALGDGVVAPPSAPDTEPAENDDGTAPEPPETAGSTAEPENGSPGSEPAVVPELDTTVSPAEDASSATGTEGTEAADGDPSTSPDPTSDG